MAMKGLLHQMMIYTELDEKKMRNKFAIEPQRCIHTSTLLDKEFDYELFTPTELRGTERQYTVKNRVDGLAIREGIL